MVLITVILGLICVLQMIFIILQYFMITAEREEMKSHKSKAEELDQTRFCVKANNTELTLDLESSVTSSSDQLEKKASKQGLYESISVSVVFFPPSFLSLMFCACFC